MYDKELMMVIIGSGTTLAGLSALVIGQVIQSKLHERVELCLKLSFTLGFLLAMAAVVSAMDWLIDPARPDKWLAFGFFVAQLFVFWAGLLFFWFLQKPPRRD